MTLDEKIEGVETALARWHSRLYRASNMIRKLEAAEKRLKAKMRQKPKPPGKADFDDPIPGLDGLLAEADKEEKAEELVIPGFLQRTPNAGDEAAKAEIIAAQAAKARASRSR